MSRRDHLLDSEERNSLALGAMDALADLLAHSDPMASMSPGKFIYLFQAVQRVVKDAIELPCSIGGVSANDE